jgi:hypothetical protein
MTRAIARRARTGESSSLAGGVGPPVERLDRRRVPDSRTFVLGVAMTAKLDKSIKRELELDGTLYTITIAPDGLKVTEKGKRKGQEISWRSIITGDASLNADLNASVDATTP